MCYGRKVLKENRGARGRHGYAVDGVVIKFAEKKKAAEEAGNCSSGMEKGTLDRSCRDGEGAGQEG
jgi:hypothetical protein